MGDRLVTIAQFSSYIEAELAKQQLADSGVEAVVTGVNSSNMYGGLPFVGLPELQVLESKAKEALEILESGKEQGQEWEEELEEEEQ
jgi:predicted Fe-Mo cluster-binding NifX family protein